MTRIGADTTLLYETVAALRQGSSNIESALQQAMQGMEALQNSRWSGQHRQQAEAIWAHIQGQFVPTIEALNELAARTERFANALEEAGREFGNEIVTISASGGLSWWETVRGRTLLKELLKEGIVRDLYEARVVTSKLHSMRNLRFERGFAYPGEVIISGSHKAKEAAYLKVKTTHMKADVINA
ncbi:WXG100 family type VII secretion target, partial [Roseiflexus sp.]|uniref:WXG100 family type VII secretion target n=1 Tax=Roseiflexus sp. TaxID=2562120 RepID=UPI00398B31C3